MQPVPNIDHLLSNIGRQGMPGEVSGEKISFPIFIPRVEMWVSTGAQDRTGLIQEIIIIIDNKTVKKVRIE